MTTERNAQGVDVLAVMDRAAEKIRFLAEKTGISHPATDLAEARAAVAELVEAVRENRAATQAFANDGHPFNYARYDASERRLEAALAKFTEPRP